MSQGDLAEAGRLFELLTEEAEKQALGAIGERALCWLALLPEWTLALAEASRFPAPGNDVEDLVEKVEREGLCTVTRPRPGAADSTVRFWMSAETRLELLERWLEQAAPDLQKEIREIATAVLAVDAEGGIEISPGVLCWAWLAQGELSTGLVTGEVLAGRVKRALAEGDASTAGEWVFAGERLAEALGAEMKLAAARAQRQIDLHYSRIQDERYRAEFVRRDEQIEEIEKLLASEEEWAVHFLGQTGVGKSRLMRYLTGSLPDDDPFTFAARVDFDYLDPRFPLEAPTRLLGELGEGLAANLESPLQEEEYWNFREAVTAAEADEDALKDSDPWRTPRFEEVVTAFAAFLEKLPKPVVLILDTCEELAKLHPAGEDLPSIKAMFEILEQVHDEESRVRVVLAGRRWLTRKAANRARIEMPAAVEYTEPREYLKMHPVLGFTEDEVLDYLVRIHKLDLADEMVEAILTLTFDPGKPAGWKKPYGPEEQPRYSPTDVALFAGWIKREPGKVKPSDLVGGDRDPYVEERIFKRIDSAGVLAAIPAAFLLERFDAETIGPALQGETRDRARVVEGLIEQEWTHLEKGPSRDETVIALDSGLLRRLRQYYAKDDRKRELEKARAALTPHLSEMFQKPTSEVPPDRIDSAVRALAPEETLRLWERLADRVVEEPAWGWAEEVGRFLLSAERVPLLPSSLVAPVRSLYIAALRHRDSSANLGELWKAVVADAAAHPVASQRRALEGRGRFGALAYEASRGSYDVAAAAATLEEGRGMLGRGAIAAAVAPGLLAAIEAMADAREERGHEIPVESACACLEELLDWFADDELLSSYVHVLCGRVRAMDGDWKRAGRHFDLLESRPLRDSFEQPSFADWLPPTSIHHRTLLELLRFRLVVEEETDELVERCELAALERPGGADGAQLLSLALQARLARNGPTESALERVQHFEQLLRGYDLAAPAHRVAPPLFASLAEAWLAVGRPERALELLLEREQLAVSLRTDEDATRAAALATVRILRALRLPERLGLIGSRSSSDDDDLRAEALAAGSLIFGRRPLRRLATGGDHAAWRVLNLLDPRAQREALAQGRKLEGAEDPSTALHLALDRLEAEMVWLRWTRIGRRRVNEAKQRAGDLASEYDAAPCFEDPLGVDELQLQLRLNALLGKAAWPVQSSRTRQVGRVALKEGELLALRLPGRAIPLLLIAQRHFDKAGYTQGAFFATLRIAIAEVHAGLPEDARGRLVEILERYGELRRDDPALPAVGELLAAAPADGSEDGLDPWNGRTRRLVAYLRWCEGEEADGASLATEPELALVPAVGARGTAVPSAPAAGQGRLTLAALGLSGLVGGLLGVFLGLVLEDTLAVLLVGAVLIGTLLAASSLVERIAKRVPRAVLPVDGFEVAVAPTSRWPADTHTAAVRVDPWTRYSLVKGYFEVWRDSRSVASVAFMNEPIGAGPEGPLGLAIRPRMLGGFAPIRLDVSTNLASRAWERCLAGHLALHGDWDPERAPEIWRVRPPGHPDPPRNPLPSPLAAICLPQRRPFVESAAGREVNWVPGDSEDPARAAIAIGFPIITRAGWRLRLDDELTDPSDAPGLRVQNLLSPDHIVRRAPVAVVIGRPGAPRLVPDSRIANRLRGFANEVFLAGAHAVIAVPSLPPKRTAEVIELFSEEATTWSSIPDSERLRLLAARLRGVVFRPLPKPPEDGEDDPVRWERERLQRAELALDVCLFAPR